ncbi:procollagen galactosyltransferase 1-like [Asterias rubens]|uniref:procollagen galactosyltransferase 1-like n=1 Tax=Asterias rubens TaxID=7604 RepID=UPI0014558E15|nr:procollagen galactosyltransferase 1-like [Asterias rubens]
MFMEEGNKVTMPRQQNSVTKLLILTILLVLRIQHILGKGTAQGSSVSDDSTSNRSWNIEEHDEVSKPAEPGSREMMTLHPTVLIPILARNKEHTLATFFGCLERLQYPKDRISLWISSDHNIDNTSNVLLDWVNKTKSLYHNVHIEVNEEPQAYDWESGPIDWPEERFLHLIQLRQTALQEARRQWADYLFAVDVDNFLENPDVLMQLMAHQKTVIAPMLESTKMYSNFWGGMNQKGYYKRTEQYVHILKRNVTGIFQVPMVHSTYLINLRDKKSTQLMYSAPPEYSGDVDDMLTFAFSARKAGIPFYVSNQEYYGSLLIPLDGKKSLTDDAEQMLHLKLESMVADAYLPSSEFIPVSPKLKTKFGFDEIYMINLKRRPERRQRIVLSLEELGIDFKIVDAVDGRALTDDDLKELGVDMLPGYRDPYHERVLTRGEIGCFLSHYFIWQEMVTEGFDKILIFEDDVRFKESFVPKIKALLQEINVNHLDWELLYIGRKIMEVDYESYLDGFQHVVKPSYTYWTLSYMLSLSGAQKLLAQKPLGKMIPVDEYLPIMFDVHPETDWADRFYPRNLKAYSVNPLLVEPTHYTGAENYVSDTETKDIWEYVLEREGISATKDDRNDVKDSSNAPKLNKGKPDISVRGDNQDSSNAKDGQTKTGQQSDTNKLNGTSNQQVEPDKQPDKVAESSVSGMGNEKSSQNEVNPHTEL